MITKSGRINLEKCVLYFVLITAFFSDWMRYKNSDITVFRIVIIAALLICMGKKTRIFIKTLLFFMLFLIYNLLQSFIFTNCKYTKIEICIFHKMKHGK